MGFKKRARQRREKYDHQIRFERTGFLTDFDPADPKEVEREILNRILSIMRQFHLTQIFYDEGRPDVTKVGSCVAESRVLARILNSVGVESKLICSDMAVFNENCRRRIIHKNIQTQVGIDVRKTKPKDYTQETRDKLAKLVVGYAQDGMDLRFLSDDFDEDTKWATTAPFSVTVYHEQSDHLGPMDNKYGHDGHCLVETPHFIVDSTLGQTWRKDLLDPPAQIIIDKEAFGKLAPADLWIDWIRPDWTYSFRSGDKDESGLSPIIRQSRMDLTGLLTPIGTAHDQNAIMQIEKDTFLAYSIRPDKNIEEIYERWNHPDFIRNTKNQVAWIKKGYSTIFGKISQGKIIDKGGKVRKGLAEGDRQRKGGRKNE